MILLIWFRVTLNLRRKYEKYLSRHLAAKIFIINKISLVLCLCTFIYFNSLLLMHIFMHWMNDLLKLLFFFTYIKSILLGTAEYTRRFNALKCKNDEQYLFSFLVITIVSRSFNKVFLLLKPCYLLILLLFNSFRPC